MLSVGIHIFPSTWNNEVSSRSLLHVSKKKETEFWYNTDIVTPVNPITWDNQFLNWLWGPAKTELVGSPSF